MSEHIAINAISELKRGSQRRKSVYGNFSDAKAKAKKPFPSENAYKRANTRLHSENGKAEAKTCPGKAVTLFTERKPCTNSFVERKRSSQSFNRVYRAKTYLGKAKKPLPSENVARKCENVSA